MVIELQHIRAAVQVAVAICARATSVLALDNGVGLTPPMGFNTYQSGLNQYDMPAIADSLTQSGLRAAGYGFVNSDAGWQPPLGARAPYLGRNSTGSPTGYLDMAALGTTLHAKGFLYGLYSALSSVQCGVAPGGLFHEELDAESYAAWGLDYLKYDNCAEYALEPNARSSPMRDALNRSAAASRPILFSTEPFDLVPNFQAHISNLWRTTTDVSATVAKVRVNLDLNDKWAEFAGPGGYNDPDLLQVGKGKSTMNEHRTNFLMWAIAKAPLLLSMNITELQAKFPELLPVLLNKEVISINQDGDGVQARKLMVDDKPVGKPIGVVECSAPDLVQIAKGVLSNLSEPFGSTAEVAAAKQIWKLVDVGLENRRQGMPTRVAEEAVLLQHGFYSKRCLALQPPNPIAYNPPFRHPTRPNPRPVWTADWQAVLLPCNRSDKLQLWRFIAPGGAAAGQYPRETATHHSRRTLSAILNEGASGAAPDGEAGDALDEIGLTVLPETDSGYGVNHVGGAPLLYGSAIELRCLERGCANYTPSAMWYLDGVTGQLQSGNYTASINEQWLTSMAPAPSRRCLSAVHSADMAGTPAGKTEVWAGPLSGMKGSLVVALSNREAPNASKISVSISDLVEPNGFFSYAMLTSRAAKAAGYARNVATPPASAAPEYMVRDVLSGTNVGKTTELVTAAIDSGDTKLFVLTPT